LKSRVIPTSEGGHCFRSAGQMVTKVSGSLSVCGRRVFTTNFLP